MAEQINILLIEDDPAIIKFLRPTLEKHISEDKHFNLTVVETASAALEQLTAVAPEVILLDLGLPDMEGLQLLRRLRESTDVPVLVISARNQERDKVLSLDLGADDYLTKPFGTAELLARIRVALRHKERSKLAALPIFSYEGLHVDLVHHQVNLNGEEIKLTPIQYDLLAVLVRNVGKVVTRQQLIRAVWGSVDHDKLDSLRIYIFQLRQKLEDDPARPKYLRTESGIGYRLHGGD